MGATDDGTARASPGLSRAQALVAAGASDSGEARERAEVADMLKCLQRGESGLVGPPPGLAHSTSWCDAARRREDLPMIGEYRRMLCSPGGFRRDHLHVRAEAAGVPEEDRPVSWSISLMQTFQSSSFVYECNYGLPLLEEDDLPLDAPLPPRPIGKMGACGVALAVFKGNLGASVLYVSHAWSQSGYVFGCLSFVIIATVCTLCVFLLLRCRADNGYSYGDLMQVAAGRSGRAMVNVCVILLQTGLCCCYLINVAEMVHKDFVPAVRTTTLILCEAVAISPFVLIRNMAKLASVNLIGVAFTLGAIVVIWVVVGRHLAIAGPDTVRPIVPSGISICLGMACLAMEGIGIVIPIYDTCRNPKRFPMVYSLTIATIVMLLCSVGLLGYLTYGSAVQTILLLDLPRGPVTIAIEAALSIQLLASFPLQLLPAVRLVENSFLKPSRPGTWDKHLKSAFRFCFVMLLAGVSALGATSLDHFVSLVGACCGAPLAYIFPAFCHLRLVAAPWSGASLLDGALIAFGAILTLAVTVQSIATWGQ